MKQQQIDQLEQVIERPTLPTPDNSNRITLIFGELSCRTKLPLLEWFDVEIFFFPRVEDKLVKYRMFGFYPQIFDGERCLGTVPPVKNPKACRISTKGELSGGRACTHENFKVQPSKLLSEFQIYNFLRALKRSSTLEVM